MAMAEPTMRTSEPTSAQRLTRYATTTIATTVAIAIAEPMAAHGARRASRIMKAIAANVTSSGARKRTILCENRKNENRP